LLKLVSANKLSFQGPDRDTFQRQTDVETLDRVRSRSRDHHGLTFRTGNQSQGYNMTIGTTRNRNPEGI